MKLRDILARFALRSAHSTAGRFLVGWTFAHLSFALPLQRILETPALVAFRHPKPSYPVHILIVPKRQMPGLESLAVEHNQLLLDVFHMAGVLTQELGLEGKGAQLIVNGGAYQLIPQLHFHLVCDSPSLETSRS